MRKRVIDPITVQLSLDSYNDFFKVVKTIDLYRREPTFLFKEKKEKSGETIYRKKASLVERASQSSSRRHERHRSTTAVNPVIYEPVFK